MRRILTIISAMLLLAASAHAREFAVSGPQGGLSMKVSLPKGFDTAKDSCHMVILMHGIFSSKDYPPMPNIAKALAKNAKLLILDEPTASLNEEDSRALLELLLKCCLESLNTSTL